MLNLSDRPAFAVAASAGAVLWIGASVFGGRREAWDSSLYWIAAYPLSIALAGIIGYAATDRPWRWGLAIMLAQAMALAAMTFSFGLLPLGLVVFGVLSVPLMLAARAGAWLRGRT